MGKLMILVLILVTLLIIGGVVMSVYYSDQKDVGEEELYYSYLKYAKCLSNCPFETVGDEEIPLQECDSACKVNFEEVKGRSEKIGEEDVDGEFFADFQRCISDFYNDSERFPVCLERFISDYSGSGYGDVPGYEEKPVYSEVDISIDNLECGKEDVKIRIVINKGRSVLEHVGFLLEGDDGQSFIIKMKESNLPGEGIFKEYTIDYLLEDIDSEIVNVKVFGILSSDSSLIIKDFESCS